jgi:allophanate hydrolase
MSGAFDLAAGRVPAMFNGCVGVKPTVGRLSTLGVVPAARALDCVTVFSQTVADGAVVARLMEVRACPRGRHYRGTML